MDQPTPQQQAQNIVDGIKNTYEAVAVRHIHPWYSWALFAAVLGFALGAAYVANRAGQFTLSSADGGVCPAAPAPTTFHGYGGVEIAVSDTLYGKYLSFKNYGIRPEGYTDEQASDLVAYVEAKTAQAKVAATEACEADYTKKYIENGKACDALASSCTASTDPKCDFSIDLPPSKACPVATCDQLSKRCDSLSPTVGIGCACSGQIAVPITTTGQLPVMPGGQDDDEFFPSTVTPAQQQGPVLTPPPTDEVKESI